MVQDVQQAGSHLVLGHGHHLEFRAVSGIGEEVNQFVAVVVTDGAVQRGRGGQSVEPGVLLVQFVAVAGNGTQGGPKAGRAVAG